MKFDIKKLYLYSATLIGLIITVMGSYQLIDLTLKAYIFKDADRYLVSPAYMKPMSGDLYTEEEYQKIIIEQQKNQDQEVLRNRKRQASTGLALLLTGLPLYLYH